MTIETDLPSAAAPVAGTGLPGVLADQCHKLGFRVYYEDTDAGGVVYHANYLNYAERGRTEALYALGYDQAQLYEDLGVIFLVRRVEADYRAPARLGDLITVTTSVGDIGGTRFVMNQVVTKDETILADMAITLVCAGRNGRPTRIPEPISRALAGLQNVAG